MEEGVTEDYTGIVPEATAYCCATYSSILSAFLRSRIQWLVEYPSRTCTLLADTRCSGIEQMISFFSGWVKFYRFTARSSEDGPVRSKCPVSS